MIKEIFKNISGLDDYMHYLEVLSDKIPRILFIRGTGKEVITTYS